MACLTLQPCVFLNLNAPVTAIQSKHYTLRWMLKGLNPCLKHMQLELGVFVALVSIVF